MTGVQTCALPICFPVTIHRIQLPAATERSEATYFPEGTPGSEERESTTSDSLLREAGNEVGRALEIWRAARRAARAEERPARAQKRPRRRLDRSTIVGRVLSHDDEILQGGGSVPDSQEVPTMLKMHQIQQLLFLLNYLYHQDFLQI